jgi:hypothetical protein
MVTQYTRRDEPIPYDGQETLTRRRVQTIPVLADVAFHIALAWFVLYVLPDLLFKTGFFQNSLLKIFGILVFPVLLLVAFKMLAGGGGRGGSSAADGLGQVFLTVLSMMWRGAVAIYRLLRGAVRQAAEGIQDGMTKQAQNRPKTISQHELTIQVWDDDGRSRFVAARAAGKLTAAPIAKDDKVRLQGNFRDGVLWFSEGFNDSSEAAIRVETPH